MENRQLIVAGGAVVDLKRSVAGGGGEVGGGQYYDHGAHGGVDIAEDPDDAFAGEADGLGGAGSVEAQVEDLAVVARKGVVEDGVVVGEIDVGSGGYGEDVRGESFVLLTHGDVGVG